MFISLKHHLSFCNDCRFNLKTLMVIIICVKLDYSILKIRAYCKVGYAGWMAALVRHQVTLPLQDTLISLGCKEYVVQLGTDLGCRQAE